MAVLDSGVHVPHPHLGAVEERVGIGESMDDGVDRLGHGTAVTAAIHDLAPGATLIVGKIFDRTLTTNASVLARGIEWAASRGARLVNLSLGTANPLNRQRLSDAITSAAAQGTIVVSAREANGILWLPGSLPGVIGVTADDQLERTDVIVGTTGLIAAPYPRAIPGVPKERNLSGVSFAVANATGVLARLLQGRPDLRDADGLLRELARTRG